MPIYVASHLKDMNRLTVYNLICRHGEISRAEISRQSGISAPTVLKIVNFLVEAGLVEEGGEGPAALGRKPQMFCLNRNRYYSIGVIHEGDYLKAGVVNLAGELVAMKRTRAEKSLGRTLGSLLFSMIDELLEESGVSLDSLLGIGIGLPAIYDPDTRSIITAPLIGISERTSIEPHLTTLREHYGKEVVVENDLSMEVQGEFHSLGLAQDNDLIYVSLGTGLGCGVMLNGELRRGRHFMCGEIGYMSFLDDYVAAQNAAGWLENRINLASLREKFGIGEGEADPGAVQSAVDYVSIPMALCINNLMLSYDCDHISLGGEVFDLLGDSLFTTIRDKVERLSVAGVQLHRKSSREPGIIGSANMVTTSRIEDTLLLD